MAKKQNVDITKWKIKDKRIRLALAHVGAAAILQSAQQVYNAADKNLSGPQITPGLKDEAGIGEMPIPRRTGTLARSLTMTPLSSVVIAVWSNSNIANYNKFVHDGTKFMRPRRFLADPVSQLGPQLEKQIRDLVLKAIRIEGRK